MDADLFVSILKDELQQSLEYYNKKPEDVLFQQDNNSKHKSKKAQKWLQENGLQLMEWPPQSADLNPIAYLWHHLKTRLGDYERPSSGIAELQKRAQKEWNDIPLETDDVHNDGVRKR